MLAGNFQLWRMIPFEKRDPSKPCSTKPVDYLTASSIRKSHTDLQAEDVSQNDDSSCQKARSVCVGRVSSCLDKTWDFLNIVADGHFTKYIYHKIWYYFILALAFVWGVLRTTMELLKDGSTDFVSLAHYGLIVITSQYVIVYREYMFEEFYFPRFLNRDRERTIACSCCCNPEEDESKCETATRECYHGEMWGKCKASLSCNHEKRVSKERTCNGLMMFLAAVVLCSILWNQGLHFVDGNCLKVEYCELKQQGLVKLTQWLELLLFFVLVIQVFAVGFQLLQFLYWCKLKLLTLKNMILHHADHKEDPSGKICRKKTSEAGLELFDEIEHDEVSVDEIEHDEVSEFWQILIEKYPESLWARTGLGVPQEDINKNLENISIENIYDFHEYVSRWMEVAPGKYYFNSIFIVCTISLSILIFITFYNIVSRRANEFMNEILPLILGTFLFLFIMSKMAAVNTLGSEVLKLYSKLRLAIIVKELANDKRKVQRLKFDDSWGDLCQGREVELITLELQDGHGEISPNQRMAITQAALNQMKEMELTIPISFPTHTCMCLQFRVRQNHINSLFLALVGPLTGLIISTYIAPALKLS